MQLLPYSYGCGDRTAHAERADIANEHCAKECTRIESGIIYTIVAQLKRSTIDKTGGFKDPKQGTLIVHDPLCSSSKCNAGI